MERFVKYLRFFIILVFLALMGYAGYMIYLNRMAEIARVELAELQERSVREAIRRKNIIVQGPMTPASGRLELDPNQIGLTSGEEAVDEDTKQPIPPSNPSSGKGGMVAEVKMPGFSVSLPETSSWMTVAKMVSLVLLTYLGVKAINLSFRKLEMMILRRRIVRRYH